MNSDEQKAKRILNALVMSDASIRPVFADSLKAVWEWAIKELKGKLDLPNRVVLDWNNLETTTAHIERLAGVVSIDEIIELAKLPMKKRLAAFYELLQEVRVPLWAANGMHMERRNEPGHLLRMAEERKKRHSG